MGKYIELDTAIEVIKQKKNMHTTYTDFLSGIHYTCDWLEERIKEIHTADVKPIVHARWLPTKNFSGLKCSACGARVKTWLTGHTNGATPVVRKWTERRVQMAEYVERDVVLTEFEKVCDICMALSSQPMCGECSVADTVRKVKRLPSADVKPVVHGEWIKSKVGIPVCSICKAGGYIARHNFCPNCGAKMDMEEET